MSHEMLINIIILALAFIVMALCLSVAFAVLEIKRIGSRIEKIIKRWR